MLSNLGNFFLILSMIYSSLAVISGVLQESGATRDYFKKFKKLSAEKQNGAIRRLILKAIKVSVSIPTSITFPATFFYLSAACILLAFLTLIYGFITSDFSLQNVFLNSSTLKPLIFKIAAAWASHESSILLWLCLLQIMGSIYVFSCGRYSERIAISMRLTLPQHLSISIIILSIIYLLFASFIYLTSSPFSVLSFKPIEGLGLNPMLQDIALVIHPPLLYLGYVSYSIPFTIACKILWTSNINQTELKLLKKFANLGILFLSAGVSLGSWWAYRELGWGGFWFFDPVENISLLPWLSGIALHHCVLMTIKSAKMLSLTITLSIITFLLAIFGTFLVRSGLIDSIHSFAASPKRAIYMLAIFSIIALASLLLLVFRGSCNYSFKEGLFQKHVKNKAPSEACSGIVYDNKFSKLPAFNGMLFGVILFLISLIVLLSSVVYPIIYAIMYQKSITISENFFINNFIIFLIPALLLAGIYTTKHCWLKRICILTISLILTYISSYKINYGIISGFTIIFSLFVILSTLSVLVTNFRDKLSEKTMSMLVGHFGFALLALSITFNSLLQSEIDFVGKIGDKTSKDAKSEFIVSLQNIKFASFANYHRQIAEFWVQDKSNNITILKPENRFYIVEKTLSQESDIYSYLTYDLYAVMSKVDGEIIHAKIYYRPMISFIWISAFIIISSFLIGILRI